MIVIYAKGVASISPGSRQRTLGYKAEKDSYPEGVTQRALCNPFGVEANV